jgi:transcriptional regulator with PAS, ATPase and Fis domain
MLNDIFPELPKDKQSAGSMLMNGITGAIAGLLGCSEHVLVLIDTDNHILALSGNGNLHSRISGYEGMSAGSLYQSGMPGWACFSAMENPSGQQQDITEGEFSHTADRVFRVNVIRVRPSRLTLLVFHQSTLPAEGLAGIFAALSLHISQSQWFLEIIDRIKHAGEFTINLVNHLSIGVFSVDHLGNIIWLNDTACQVLQCKRDEMTGKHVSGYLAAWPEAIRKISLGETFLDEESQFLSGPSRDKYLFNVYSLGPAAGKNPGYMITFREYRRILNLVNRYSGSHARFQFDDIIAISPVMTNLLDFARRVADSPSSVLITGESGTGKEVFAQAIHQASSRRDAGFIAINCGAISPTLIESELFGYEEGAFTGAKKGGRPGKFELADKGTLFLDEIGEMSPDMQVKLLRAIQEGRVTRVGGSKEIPVDVRIIAATNRNPAEAINAGRFRPDLYYRLNVIPLSIPPLRERREDIRPLFKLFLKQKAGLLGRRLPYISPVIMDSILAYSWPGNIRELENFTEKAVLLDGKVEAPCEKPNLSSEDFIPAPRQTEKKNVDASPPLSLEEAEVLAIRDALAYYSNNITAAAARLKISRNTLYLKLKRYNL